MARGFVVGMVVGFGPLGGSDQMNVLVFSGKRVGGVVVIVWVLLRRLRWLGLSI